MSQFKHPPTPPAIRGSFVVVTPGTFQFPETPNTRPDNLGLGSISTLVTSPARARDFHDAGVGAAA